MASTTIVIVDDHPIVRAGVRMVLENDPEMQVVGEAGSVREACEVVTAMKPDIVLLDLNLGSESSADRVEEIRICSPDSKVLIVTGVLDEDANRVAAEHGAMGIVLKNQAADTLMTAIRKVNQGEVWFDRAFTAKILNDMAERNAAAQEDGNLLLTLTAREHEIVSKIGEGLVNKDIATALGISEKTVRNCLTTIYEKLGVTSRLELALFLGKHLKHK